MSDGKRLGRGDALRKHLEQLNAGRTAPISSLEGSPDGQNAPPRAARPAGRSALFATIEKQKQEEAAAAAARSAGSAPGAQGSRGRALFLSKIASSSSSSGSRPVTPGEIEEVTKGIRHLAPTERRHVPAEVQPREPVIQRGTRGQSIPLLTNYVRLRFVQGGGMFQYDVQFNPEVDSRNLRYNLVKQRSDVLGTTRLFDGHVMYLPIRLPLKDTILDANLPTDNSPVQMIVKFVCQRDYGDRESVHLYNILFRKIMTTLGFAEHGDNFYDPKNAMAIPMHKLEVWPGYITTVDEYEDGLMLCCDASHRVLRNQTVLDLMQDLENTGKEDWSKQFVQMILGQSVLTRYNNKVYRIHDIDFDETPLSTFDKNGDQVNYVDYYRHSYNLQIRDRGQPLLKSKFKRKIRGMEDQMISLIPELCYLTGITDEMRADFKVMKDVTQCINLNPQQRHYAINKFVMNVKESPEATKILSNWGLSLDTAYLSLTGRVMQPESITFGGNVTIKGNMEASWSGPSNKNLALSAIEMVKWAVVCTKRDEPTVIQFVEQMMKCSPNVGMRILKPLLCTIPDDRTDNYIRKLKGVINESCQIVLVIIPLARNDKYSAVKKLCCIDQPVASQVMLSKTVRKGTTARAIPMKVAFQMNCKLGGTLWGCYIPLQSTMVMGLDAYHDPRRKSNSVGALVASLNQPFTRWYSKVFFQAPGYELADALIPAVIICLTKWKEENGKYPELIVFYRDGVSDGQLPMVKRHEIPQIQAAFKKIQATYEPKLLYVVVQKKINTRMLSEERGGYGNPPPGTVLDHTVTRRYLYDFFLVSQHVTQGTVSPTHYIVVHNTTTMPPDQVQRLSFILTHLYYNWPGTIRVPAPCQYAHKLAYLVGENIHKEADEVLADKLFYL